MRIKGSSISSVMPIVQLIVFLSSTIIVAAGVVTPFLLLQLAFAQQASFGNPIPLDNSVGEQDTPHIASYGSNVYVAYTSELNGQSSILFTRSTDGGASFSTPISVSDDQGRSFSFLSAIAADGNNVYVVWTRVTDRADLFLVKSTDGGATFSSPIQVENRGNARASAIAVSGDNVYVTWADFTTSQSSLEPEIFFAASIDGGATFNTPVDISNTAGTLSRLPSIAAFGNNAYVVWIDCNPNGTNCRTLYTKSNDVGVTFTTPVPLSDPESSRPDIAVQGNTVYVIYGQEFANSQNRDVFLIKGTDTAAGGTVFGNSVNLSDDPSPSDNPRIHTSGSNVAIQWQDRDPSAAVPHWEVVFVGSTDSGVTFGSRTSVSSSFPTSDSTSNDIAVSDSNLYSTWTVFQNNSFDVYFAKGILTPITPVDNIPPDTTITSAVDGNNVRLNGGDSTDSNKITFTFKGTDNVAVAGFECRLDGDSSGNNFNPCTSPITYNNLNSGVHTFEVRAIDTSGNKDPTPAKFSWNLLVSSTAAETGVGEQEVPNVICTHPNSKAIC
jgi:hypothetical protein